jgi:hypothetical protein
MEFLKPIKAALIRCFQRQLGPIVPARTNGVYSTEAGTEDFIKI